MSNSQLDKCVGSTLRKCSTFVEDLFLTNLDMYKFEFQVCGLACQGNNGISNDMHDSLYKPQTFLNQILLGL